MSTTLATPLTADRQWLLVDAKGIALGRLASRLAMVLRGKHKPIFTPYIDTGDFVVVVNVSQMRLSGQKRVQKTYDRYSGYPGGRKVRTLERIMETHPDRALRDAVQGMMPHGPLGRRMLKKLKICAGPEHPYKAQKPQPINPELIGAQHG